MKSVGSKRQCVSAFLLAVFLSLQAMAALPALHAFVHHDSSDPNHECAVTLLLHGQVDAASAAAPVFEAPQFSTVTAALPETIFVSADLRLLPSRGPPASAVLA